MLIKPLIQFYCTHSLFLCFFFKADKKFMICWYSSGLPNQGFVLVSLLFNY